MKHIAASLMTFAVLGLVTVNAHAEPVKSIAQKAKVQKQTPLNSVGVGGLVVVKDPVTGEIVQPSAADMKQLMKARSSTKVQQPQAFTAADGSPGVRLPEDMMVFSVATKSAEGKVQEQCVTGEKVAEALLNKTTQVRKTTPQKKEVLDVQ